MPTDPDRVQAVFLVASEVGDRAERARLLDRACEADTGLRSRVEALLRAHDNPDSLLDHPAVSSAVSGHGSTWEFSAADPQTDTANNRTARYEGDSTADAASLGFLEPGTRPDSLGRIGHYEVLQVIGRGGFGIVFRVFDDVLQREVAVKVLSPYLAATSPARKRFVREARSAAAVRHENVVQVYEVGETPLPYLVMEYIPGETLQQKLDRVGPTDPAEVVRVGRQVAEGLAAAHATGLIHRDIKPGNILLESGQQKAKISDFGLARAADDANLSQSGAIAGTPRYMAPEQALGQKLDQRADLFSLGSVLYQMAAGRPPFRANGTMAVLKRVAEDTPRDIREIIPETPQWLCDVIAKLHAKNPADRYQSAREVADVLADCEAQLKDHATIQDYSRLPRTEPRRSGRRNWAAVAAAAAVVFSTVAVAVTEAVGVTRLFRGRSAALEPVTPSSGPATPSSGLLSAPAVKPNPSLPPFTDADARRIAALPVDQQVDEVRKELLRRNPGFRGSLIPVIKDGGVTELTCRGTGRLADLSPLRGLKLTKLDLLNTVKGTDLTPLRGMPLEQLNLWPYSGSDLTPLRGMPLRRLMVGGGHQKLDLAQLGGLRLEHLNVISTQVSDLTPLAGMPLINLLCSHTPVSDLSPLKGMQLRLMDCNTTSVSDLSPLKGMPIELLTVEATGVTDLTPLAGMPLETVRLTPSKITRGMAVLRDMKSLTTIGISVNQQWPAEEFWKRYDRGEFLTDTTYHR